MISVITPEHDPKHLRETLASMLAQTFTHWEWVVVVNGQATLDGVRDILSAHGTQPFDPRIRIEQAPPDLGTSIGALKLEAFSRGRGNILVELDHDDLLSTNALAEIVNAFQDTSVDFVYSNCTDFADGTADQYYYYPDWQKNGWRYRTTPTDGRQVAECVAFQPSAAMVSLIYYAPNHVRAWRRSFYTKIGGHSPSYAIADDHELLIRTYLHGKMKHIDKCLYLYRMGTQNTFATRVKEIEGLTYQLHARNIEALVLREGELRNLPCYDLGGAFACPPGWISVDREAPAAVVADLAARWPFKDSSVMAFRAHDIIEHVADKQHFMSELHRCLVPGGWALINVPSTDGRGAWQDPTHVSFWNENAFWYWTRPNIAAYIRNHDKMFITRRLFTHFPSEWHKEVNIPYTTAELIAYKGDMTEVPGVRP